jgi:hypothetical protein
VSGIEVLAGIALLSLILLCAIFIFHLDQVLGGIVNFLVAIFIIAFVGLVFYVILKYFSGQ